MLKLLTAPVTNDRSPRYMERALAAIHQAQRKGESLTLIYAAQSQQVGLYLEFSQESEERITGPITAHYPNCTLTKAEDFEPPPPDWETWSAELVLMPELFPILRHAQFEDLLNGKFADPAGGILRAIRPTEKCRCRVEISLVPANPRHQSMARQAVRLLDRDFFRQHPRLAGFFAARRTHPRYWLLAWPLAWLAKQSALPARSSLDTSAGRLHDREDHLQAAADKLGGHLFETKVRLIVSTAPRERTLAVDRMRQLAGAFGAFTQSRLAMFRLGRIRKGNSFRQRKRGSLLSHEELATLFHPPTAMIGAEGLQSMSFSELEPPAKFYSGSEPGAVTLGRVRFRTDERLIGIDEDARRRHMYIVGATGAGKSTLLLHLMGQDMRAGRGLTVLDVHGDLADAALGLVPKHRTNDVIVFEAAADHVVPFNPLACTDPSRIDQVTSGTVSAFKKLYDSWGPRLENLLRYAIFTTVEQQGTLLDVLRLLTDKNYRDQTVLRVQDEVVRSFWQNEFASWNVQYRTEAVSAVTNKLMPFLASRQLRAITSSSGKASLNLRQVMDEGKLLIINLSRGRLGQDNSTLLGSLLLSCIEQAAMTRAEIPEPQRLDHQLYLDEFQSLTTPSTAMMLSESRKYRLCLTLSHQLTRQLDPATYHAVIGNCGTLLAFRVGLEDAELLASAFSKHSGQLPPADLCNLPNYTAYTRLLIEGQPSSPFSLSTLSPNLPGDDEQQAEIVRHTSQRRYAVTV